MIDGRREKGEMGMARLVFGMNQSLDGYVDHTAFAPSPGLFRLTGGAGTDMRGGISALLNGTPNADVAVTADADLVGPADPSGTGASTPRPGRRTASAIATGRQPLDGKPTRTAGAPRRRGAEAARQHP